MDYGRRTKQRKTTFNLEKKNGRGTQENREKMERTGKNGEGKKGWKCFVEALCSVTE